MQFSWRTLHAQAVLLAVHAEWANPDQYALIQSKPHDHTYVVFSNLTAIYKNQACDNLIDRETGSKANWIDRISVNAENKS